MLHVESVLQQGKCSFSFFHECFFASGLIQYSRRSFIRLRVTEESRRAHRGLLWNGCISSWASGKRKKTNQKTMTKKTQPTCQQTTTKNNKPTATKTPKENQTKQKNQPQTHGKTSSPKLQTNKNNKTPKQKSKQKIKPNQKKKNQPKQKYEVNWCFSPVAEQLLFNL